jgi:hypothetical protein
MRMSIALNGSFFNTQRMVMQYVNNAYLAREEAAAAAGKKSNGVVAPSSH